MLPLATRVPKTQLGPDSPLLKRSREPSVTLWVPANSPAWLGAPPNLKTTCYGGHRPHCCARDHPGPLSSPSRPLPACCLNLLDPSAPPGSASAPSALGTHLPLLEVQWKRCLPGEPPACVGRVRCPLLLGLVLSALLESLVCHSSLCPLPGQPSFRFLTPSTPGTAGP